jgi:tetratricopeptide (TPR) repeat protein
MKRTQIALFAILLLAANMQAQGQRRRTGGDPNPVRSGSGVFDGASPLAVMRARLESESAAPAGHAGNPGNAVPVSQLRIPMKAMKEFERAQKAFQAGDIHSSAEHLHKALQIYPDFLQAHNALGLRYVQLGDYQKALAEHQLALSLDPRSAQTHQDLSLALLLLDRSPEAETEARLALDLDTQAAAARYVLGRALIAQRRLTNEAMEMLRQSEDTFPNASLVLAQIHFTGGQTEQVIAELRHYLRAPADQENKQKAECWVAQLSRQTLPAGCPAEITRPAFR